MTAQTLLASLSNTTLRVIRDDLKREQARSLLGAERAPFLALVEHELSLSDVCSEHGTEVQT